MDEIFDIWPTVKDMADDLCQPYTTVHSWKRRGRIPSSQDVSVVAAAKRRGKVVTFAELARLRHANVGAQRSPEKIVAAGQSFQSGS